MKKVRFLSIFLVAALLAGLLAVPAMAAESGTSYEPITSRTPTSSFTPPASPNA